MIPWQAYVCQNIPRHVLESTYGINIIKPREDEDPHRPPTSEELLTAYGCELWFILKHEQKSNNIVNELLLQRYEFTFFLIFVHVIFQPWSYLSQPCPQAVLAVGSECDREGGRAGSCLSSRWLQCVKRFLELEMIWGPGLFLRSALCGPSQ